ncbi:MAG: hypothetical protein GX076_02230 [Clostridiales bacterium]|nr:hypothetical protein [Clostridiales bacterium]
MKLHKYLGCSYELYFEEIDIKFIVHRDLIDENTRELIKNYVFTGILPEGINVNTTEGIVCFEPISCRDSNPQFEPNEDYLWFAL